MKSTTPARGEGSFAVGGGLRLHYHTWEVVEPRAALIVVHGLSEHGGRYEKLGLTLAGLDVSTFALDLRGHGLSEGRRGHAPTFASFLQDLDRFRREVLGLVDPATPIFLLGHSMGGLIALRYQEEYPGSFNGAVIVSPWLATAIPVPRWKVNLANVVARVLPALPFNSEIHADLLSRDPAVVAAYRDDPLIHRRITPGLFVEASREMGLTFQRSERITVPLLFLLAGSDRIVDSTRSLAFARTLGGADVVIKVYPDFYHEVLNEKPAGQWVDLTAWLRERLH
jgi:alpha-beta hydrolase superfamily lysophospholipase